MLDNWLFSNGFIIVLYYYDTYYGTNMLTVVVL